MRQELVYPRVKLVSQIWGHSFSECIEVVGVPLHHDPPLCHVKGLIVFASDAALDMRKLAFNVILQPAMLSEERARCVANSVAD
ncbi:hypothetical protein D9M71_679650 [compost metagenome]